MNSNYSANSFPNVSHASGANYSGNGSAPSQSLEMQHSAMHPGSASNYSANNFPTNPVDTVHTANVAGNSINNAAPPLATEVANYGLAGNYANQSAINPGNPISQMPEAGYKSVPSLSESSYTTAKDPVVQVK
jgi:hypothetical protein